MALADCGQDEVITIESDDEEEEHSNPSKSYEPMFSRIVFEDDDDDLFFREDQEEQSSHDVTYIPIEEDRKLHRNADQSSINIAENSKNNISILKQMLLSIDGCDKQISEPIISQENNTCPKTTSKHHSELTAPSLQNENVAKFSSVYENLEHINNCERNIKLSEKFHQYVLTIIAEIRRYASQFSRAETDSNTEASGLKAWQSLISCLNIYFHLLYPIIKECIIPFKNHVNLIDDSLRGAKIFANLNHFQFPCSDAVYIAVWLFITNKAETCYRLEQSTCRPNNAFINNINHSDNKVFCRIIDQCFTETAKVNNPAPQAPRRKYSRGAVRRSVNRSVDQQRDSGTPHLINGRPWDSIPPLQSPHFSQANKRSSLDLESKFAKQTKDRSQISALRPLRNSTRAAISTAANTAHAANVNYSIQPSVNSEPVPVHPGYISSQSYLMTDVTPATFQQSIQVQDDDHRRTISRDSGIMSPSPMLSPENVGNHPAPGTKLDMLNKTLDALGQCSICFKPTVYTELNKFYCSAKCQIKNLEIQIAMNPRTSRS